LLMLINKINNIGVKKEGDHDERYEKMYDCQCTVQSLRPINEDFDLIGPVGRAAITTGSAGAAFGFTEVGEALDARLHDKIKRAGARRPRLWLAAGEGAVAATAWWLGRRIDNAAVANVEEFGEFGTET